MDPIGGIPPLIMVPPQELLAQGEVQRLTRIAGRAGNSPEEIRAAAREFEGFFLAYLLKIMRETVPKGMMDSKAADQFMSFYDQELGRRAAEAGGIGIGRFLEAYLLQDGQPDEGHPQVLQRSNR